MMEYDKQAVAKKEFSKAGLQQPLENNISRLVSALLIEIAWVEKLVDTRIEEIKNPLRDPFLFSQVEIPRIEDEENPYAQLVRQLDLSAAERLLLVCSLIQHISPEALTQKLRDDKNHLRLAYIQMGGYLDRAFMHFVPTMQTVLYLLAGNDKTNAAYYKLALNRHGKLVREGIISFNPLPITTDEQNELQFIPTITQEYLYYFQSGVKPRPDFGRAFPATWVSTGLNWNQLVLPDNTLNQVKDIMRWVEHGHALAASNSMFNASYPCLFYGPPGTGKSLTAKLIGKQNNKDVFRIDLSMIVSKYVGETEKNLAHLFNRAENKDWILFFDEADTLFSKRTSVSNANDKWANLEVSYLLQRIEEYKGLVILATNLKDNLDPAMTRRFQSIIYFPLPDKKVRSTLWKNLLPYPFVYPQTINFEKLGTYEFSGANISNILKDACLSALAHHTHELKTDWITHAIKKEFIKEKRTP